MLKFDAEVAKMFEQHWEVSKDDMQLTNIKRSYSTLYSAKLKNGTKVVLRATVRDQDKAEKKEKVLN